MTRFVLVHGSVTHRDAAWRAQQQLAERSELVVLNRPRFPPGPLVPRVEAERAVLPGAGHTVQRAPGFTERLEAVVSSAAKRAARRA